MADFSLPNPGAAFNAMFQTMAPFLEIARATQARRYALEPHFTRNALHEKEAELEAMNLANQQARNEMDRSARDYRDQKFQDRYARSYAPQGVLGADRAAAIDRTAMQGMPSSFQAIMSRGAPSPWEDQYNRVNRPDSQLWSPK